MLEKYVKELKSCEMQMTIIKTRVLGSPGNKYNEKAMADLKSRIEYIANNLKEFAQRL